jgi:two-component system, OmpR family, sensor histidine kinase ArlS
VKIRTKITLLFSLIVTAIIFLLSITLYYFSSLERSELFYKRLKSRATYNAQVLSLVNADNVQALNKLNASVNLFLKNTSIGIYQMDGTPLYRYTNDRSADIVPDRNMIGSVLTKNEVRFRRGKRDAIAFHWNDVNHPLIIVMAAYDADGWAHLNRLKRLLVITMLFGMVMAFIIGIVFSKQLLYPIANMIREVNMITSQNLNSSIHVGKSKDEMNQLATTFNNLLHRLQEYFVLQRKFISAASHELSTPLTSISSQLQVALQRERSTEEYKHVMMSVQEDVQQMLLLTRSLLEIAKTGASGSIELKEVRVDELLFKVMADVQKLSPEYHVELNFEDFPDDDANLMVFGNSELLYIAFKNIIENGCKFAPDHYCSASLKFDSSGVVISVHNKGTYIREKEKERIFQPFYRAMETRHLAGFGLGLAMTKRIMGLHRGSIEVNSSQANGTTFLLTLPSVRTYHEAGEEV